MRDNEDPQQDDGGPNNATHRLGTGMFSFYLFILFTNELYIYTLVFIGTTHWQAIKDQQRPTTNKDQ